MGFELSSAGCQTLSLSETQRRLSKACCWVTILLQLDWLDSFGLAGNLLLFRQLVVGPGLVGEDSPSFTLPTFSVPTLAHVWSSPFSRRPCFDLELGA